MSILFRFAAITILLIQLVSCREQYTKLRSSSRLVASEYSIMERSASQAFSLVKKKTGDTGSDTMSRHLASTRQKNLINDYEFLYTALNLNSAPDKSVDIGWDSSLRTHFIRDSSIRKINSEVEVFGWHPSWMGENWMSYPYNLLTTVSFYGYIVDPATGGCHNPEDMDMWRSMSIVDSAHAKNCRVLLTVACQGQEQTASFLGNENAWGTLADSVMLLLTEKNADGVDLNFSDMPSDSKRTFLRFVAAFRARLNASLSQSYLAISLPAENENGFFDVQELQRHADALVISGFEYKTEDEASGAVAPLTTPNGKGPSLEGTLDTYIAQGIDTRKTILALPLYGAQWKATKNSKGIYESVFDKKITYSEIRMLYNTIDTAYRVEPSLDANTMTNYYFMEFPDQTALECWYDDDYTMGRKMDLAMSRNLRGVGLWALGYDQGHREFWQLLKDKYSTDTLRITDPVTYLKGYPIQVAGFFLKYADLLVTAAIVFAITMVIAMFIAFSDWRVRESFFYSQLNFYVYILVSTLLIIPLLGLIDFFDSSQIRSLFAFLTGIGIGYVIFRLSKVFQIHRP